MIIKKMYLIFKWGNYNATNIDILIQLKTMGITIQQVSQIFNRAASNNKLTMAVCKEHSTMQRKM